MILFVFLMCLMILASVGTAGFALGYLKGRRDEQSENEDRLEMLRSVNPYQLPVEVSTPTLPAGAGAATRFYERNPFLNDFASFGRVTDKTVISGSADENY
jgi:hypothetical protein